MQDIEQSLWSSCAVVWGHSEECCHQIPSATGWTVLLVCCAVVNYYFRNVAWAVAQTSVHSAGCRANTEKVIPVVLRLVNNVFGVPSFITTPKAFPVTVSMGEPCPKQLESHHDFGKIKPKAVILKWFKPIQQ